VKIKYEEKIEKMIVKSDYYPNFQIFNTRFEFFDELCRKRWNILNFFYIYIYIKNKTKKDLIIPVIIKKD